MAKDHTLEHGMGGRPDVGRALPLVSVLTPSFNQATWLGDNLASVAAQSYPNIEHIVMDGASTDGTLDLLRQRAGPQVNWSSEPDRGQSHALNKAYQISRGEILGWLNSDDAYFGPTAVADAVELFREHPDVAVVYGHAVLVDSAGLILQVVWSPPYSHALLRLHDFITQPAAFVRRSAVGELLVDESYDFTMDYELWLRLARTSRMLRLDRVVAVDRHHPHRKSYAMAAVGRADHRRLVESYGVKAGPGHRILRKGWKFVSRISGARLVRAAHEQPVVFEANRDGILRLLLRQVAIPRRFMRS